MNKKVLRAGAVSAVAAGIGAAAVMAGKRRSKKEEENSDYRLKQRYPDLHINRYSQTFPAPCVPV